MCVKFDIHKPMVVIEYQIGVFAQIALVVEFRFQFVAAFRRRVLTIGRFSFLKNFAIGFAFIVSFLEWYILIELRIDTRHFEF